MKWVWIGLAAAVVIAIVAGSIVQARNKGIVAVTVAAVERKAFVREVSGSGRVEAREYALTFARAGRVERIFVREGDRVAAGAVLAELSVAREKEDLVASRERLTALRAAQRAAVEEGRAGLRKLDAQLTETRTNLKLSRQLLAAGAASRDEMRSLERQLATLEAERDASAAGTTSRGRDLDAQIANLQADVQGLERVLRESRLTAPVAGLVAKIDFRIGEAAQGAVKLVEHGTLRARVRLAEADTVGVEVGQPARVELDADPEHPLAAEVARLGVTAETEGQSGSAVLPVTLNFLGSDAAARARAGYTITGRITTLRLKPTAQVPLESLVEEETDGEKTRSVWRVDPKLKTVSRVLVTVLARNLTRAAVTGIDAGALIVTLPPDTLKAGTKVRFTPLDAKEKAAK